MNNKQIHRFVKKVNFGYPVTIKYVNKKNNIAAVASFSVHYNKNNTLATNGFIEINNVWRNGSSDNTLKACLMHEVGHFYTSHAPVQNKSKKVKLSPPYMREYYAQVWALLRVKKLKLKNVEKSVIRDFEQWKFLDWKLHRPYMLAYRLAVEGGVIKNERKTPYTEKELR